MLDLNNKCILHYSAMSRTRTWEGSGQTARCTHFLALLWSSAEAYMTLETSVISLASWLQQGLALMGFVLPLLEINIRLRIGFKFNLYHAQDKFNRQQFDDIFIRQRGLTFRRQFAWNAKPCFLEQIRNKMQNVVCFFFFFFFCLFFCFVFVFLWLCIWRVYLLFL